MNNSIDISVIMPVGARRDRTGKLVEQYLAALEETGTTFEMICVLDGPHEEVVSQLVELSKEKSTIRIIQLSKPFGETTALAIGADYANGVKILTLPAYFQIDPPEIQSLINQFEECDMAIAVRSPRAIAGRFEKIRRDFFHWLVRFLGGEKFLDLGCNVRLMRREVFDEVPLYGDQARFLPLIASRRGFRVREVALRQSPDDKFHGRYKPRVYARRLLDIFTVFFLTRFTKKPLRFFGMIGSVTTLVGGAFLIYVVFERLVLNVSLADRPALLLSSLLVVLGLQIFALGLLGELIIFTHARDIKEYSIEKIVN